LPAGDAHGGSARRARSASFLSEYQADHEVKVHIPDSATKLLSEKYPHCAELLSAFAPLLELQFAVAASLPRPELPAPERDLFLQGKAWLLPDKANLGVYLDEPFLDAAPDRADEAAPALPALRGPLKELGAFLRSQRGACRDLIALALMGNGHRVPYWSKKHGQNKDAAALFAAQLAGAAARRVAGAAAPLLPSWDKGWCPICGRRPHAGYLGDREGRRFLQCSLCGHTRRFSRTVCPLCGEARTEKLRVFFLEGDALARAEGCGTCGRYLLMPDLRESLGGIPLELITLCLMPLDLLMREQGYLPGTDKAVPGDGTKSRS
jgi:FdhE protein